jgi:hypothetical protein
MAEWSLVTTREELHATITHRPVTGFLRRDTPPVARDQSTSVSTKGPQDMKITIRTTPQGDIDKRTTIDPPLLRNRRVRISIKVVSPADIVVTGTIDIDAVDGDTSNSPRPFTARTGQRVDLGVWQIDKDENRVVVLGKTAPALLSGDLVVAFDYDLV